MRIHHNKTFDCYEDCEQDINAFGKEIFLDGHKLYTKADLVAVLTDLQLKIEELNHKGSNCYRDGYTPYSEGLDDCKEIIQQKIDKLKENKE